MTKKNYTFVFLTMPAFGHLNPMLIIIEELIRLGHKVIVYNSNEFSEIIKKTGAEFKIPPVKIKIPDFLEFRDSFRIAEISIEISKKIVFPLIESIKKDQPDCIIHDSLSLFGKIISNYLNVPSISLVPSMVINLPVLIKSKIRKEIFIETLKNLKRFSKINREYSLIFKNLNLKSPIIFDIFSNKEDLNIVFTSKLLQINGNRFNKEYRFVGPSIYDRNQLSLPDSFFNTKSKIIYISLGSIYNDRLDFFKKCIKAFKNTNYKVFISFGNHIKKSQLGKIPKNIYIDKYLPQLQILDKADLFITHGGMNSINESCFYGVPMFLFPQMLEQKANAYRIDELGAGILYRKNLVDADDLLNFSNKIIINSSYKKNAFNIGNTFKEAGGYREAVRLIIDFINNRL